MFIKMTKNVLVCYGTRYGATAEIAERIAQTLRNRKAIVDIVNLKAEKPAQIEQYELIIIGSGIAAGKWTKEPLKWMKKHKEAISGKKVALFVSCAYAVVPDKKETARTKYLEKIAEKYLRDPPESLGLFGGVIDFSKYNFIVRRIMNTMVKANRSGDEPLTYLDFRDWKQIEEWARLLLI
jgi:menaquinone-dependent protoporphyrinogen oxidase